MDSLTFKRRLAELKILHKIIHNAVDSVELLGGLGHAAPGVPLRARDRFFEGYCANSSNNRIMLLYIAVIVNNCFCLHGNSLNSFEPSDNLECNNSGCHLAIPLWNSSLP